jgi:hypothetical protein
MCNLTNLTLSLTALRPISLKCQMLKKFLSRIKAILHLSSISPFWLIYNNRNSQIWPSMPDNWFLSLNLGHTNGPQLTALCMLNRPYLLGEGVDP